MSIVHSILMGVVLLAFIISIVYVLGNGLNVKERYFYLVVSIIAFIGAVYLWRVY